MSSPRAVTIVGGGISGLSAAFHLSRRFPPASGTRITLVEKSPRLGGWVLSERVRVQDRQHHQADVLLESGPRTLRPASKATLELINLLGLSASVLAVPLSAPAARNRFLHLPGINGLATIPNSLLSLPCSPLAKVLVPAVLQAARKLNGNVLNASHSNDESVDAFLTRHFGAQFAQMFGSALVHGIYAADSRMLSVRTAFPALLELEERGRGNVVLGTIRGMLSISRRNGAKDIEEYDVGGIGALMKGVSVYSFRDGMQTLTDGMVRRLEELGNVEVIRGDGVATLRRIDNVDEFEIQTVGGRRVASSHIVMAISLPHIAQLLSTEPHAPSALCPPPHLFANPSSSVTVVNLVFPSSSSPLHPAGFGYLIPRPPADYPSSSLGMLGVVFDSCALPSQDIPIGPPSPDSPFTKMTVMLGGPYGTPSPHPSSKEFVPLLLETLRRQLGRSDSEPVPVPCLVRIREHQECIPTPTVGHSARVAELVAAVRERWGPNAAVIGAGVGGVSVGDCVESGRRAALALVV